MFNFHKGTYVIKTLCNWVQIWTWVILADADITEATLNSLSDLALDFIIVIFLFLCREENIKNARGKSVYSNSRWPKHTRKHVVKKYHRQSQTFAFGQD